MASDAFNITPYHCAAIHPSSSYLAEFYEALDAAERLETDSFGRSIAFYAAVSETTACLEYLISKNFNLTIPDKYKMTPLLQAARFGRSHNVELLIKFQIGDNSSNEASSVVFQSLVRNRRTALHYAAFFGHADTCKVLIKYGAAVEPIENLDKQTPLHFAAKNGYLECVRVLIEDGGANPEKGDKFSRNALHLACIYGHVDIVRYLLSVGVNADSSDSSQNSPAHYASAYGYIKILHLLIAYGSADPASTNVWRSTPCSVANMKGHLGIVKYLLQLPGHPIDVNFKDPEGLIMLQHAISEHVSTNNEVETNLKKVELLISMDADVNSVDIYGKKSNIVLSSDIRF
jgi:ankyrin repeat protein